MKIAIVHDYIKEYGGAERVVEELVKLFPESVVYTTIFMPQFLGPHRNRVEKWNIKTTWFQRVPFKGKFISIARLIAPLVFKNLDLSDFDVVITSTAGTYTSPNFVKIGKKTKLISYCHTPPRYLYGYKTANNWDSNPGRKFLKTVGLIPMHFLRMADFDAAQRPNLFLANSEEVRARIKKFYRRDAQVIYPPVEIPNPKLQVPNKVTNSKSQIRNPKHFTSVQCKQIINEKSIDNKYYLAGGRLARAKGMDVIIEAFIKNGKPLKVFGRGFAGYQQELESRIKNQESRIEFVGEVTDEEKFELMRNAKAFVFASHDEDFGITPVESMGVGTPIIAYKSGGVKETVVDGKTGIFYEPNTSEELNKAIEKFEKTKIRPEDCVAQAKKFSPKEFDSKIKQIVAQA